MEARIGVPNGGCTSFCLGSCFHRGRCWPDGECLCLSQCQPMARKTRLVFESIPGACHILRSRDANWFSIYFSACENTGASRTQYGWLLYGSAGDPGSPDRRCGPEAMEGTTISAKAFRATFPIPQLWGWHFYYLGAIFRSSVLDRSFHEKAGQSQDGFVFPFCGWFCGSSRSWLIVLSIATGAIPVLNSHGLPRPQYPRFSGSLPFKE